MPDDTPPVTHEEMIAAVRGFMHQAQMVAASYPKGSTLYVGADTTATALLHVIATLQQVPALIAALQKIACFDDDGADRHLSATGSYSMFDEPGSVKIARDALAASPSGEAR